MIIRRHLTLIAVIAFAILILDLWMVKELARNFKIPVVFSGWPQFVAIGVTVINVLFLTGLIAYCLILGSSIQAKEVRRG